MKLHLDRVPQAQSIQHKHSFGLKSQLNGKAVEKLWLSFEELADNVIPRQSVLSDGLLTHRICTSHVSVACVPLGRGKFTTVPALVCLCRSLIPHSQLPRVPAVGPVVALCRTFPGFVTGTQVNVLTLALG